MHTNTHGRLNSSPPHWLKHVQAMMELILTPSHMGLVIVVEGSDLIYADMGYKRGGVGCGVCVLVWEMIVSAADADIRSTLSICVCVTDGHTKRRERVGALSPPAVVTQLCLVYISSDTSGFKHCSPLVDGVCTYMWGDVSLCTHVQIDWCCVYETSYFSVCVFNTDCTRE